MRKLALSDEILMKIEKPARYIGGEFNAIVKDHNEVDTTFAFVFPDVYEVGMSHLGIQILYDLLNRRDDVCCERVYSPWIDLDKIMREQNICSHLKHRHLLRILIFLQLLFSTKCVTQTYYKSLICQESLFFQKTEQKMILL